MMNISVMAAFVCIYIRYKQIQNLLCDACAISINRLSCAFGIISSLGISMVANFQEKTTLKLIHEIGAGLLMISGILYQMTQSYLTYKTSKDKICFCCRLLILVISLTASIATQVTKFIVESDMLCNNHWFHWTPGESNYKMHIVSAATEWIVAFAFLIFFATFTLDFSQCSLHVQAIVHPQTDKRTLRTLTVEQENPDIIPLLPLN
ncbi:DNA damage-regulated autophagy modulator protein 2-like isoform X2 [Clavelina lepadiformis]